MAESDTSDLLSKGVKQLSSVDNESEGYFGNLNLLPNAPHQDEHLTVHGQIPAREFPEDPNRIPIDVLAAREEGQIRLDN